MNPFYQWLRVGTDNEIHMVSRQYALMTSGALFHTTLCDIDVDPEQIFDDYPPSATLCRRCIRADQPAKHPRHSKKTRL